MAASAAGSRGGGGAEICFLRNEIFAKACALEDTGRCNAYRPAVCRISARTAGAAYPYENKEKNQHESGIFQIKLVLMYNFARITRTRPGLCIKRGF